MEIIETISPRACVVNDNGRICARIERSSYFIEQIDCGTDAERARQLARAGAWELLMGDWMARVHAAIVAQDKPTCDACPYRNTSGCLSAACPVFRVLDCANKSAGLVKRTAKTLRSR